MWYVAGSTWIKRDNKDMPVYSLYYQESRNGLKWEEFGKPLFNSEYEDEHGYGRPWVVLDNNQKYNLFFSVRKTSIGQYRLGYAISDDGQSWERNDSHFNLDVSENAFDANAIMYSAILNYKNDTYCFYNGDNFGEEGFGVAKLL